MAKGKALTKNEYIDRCKKCEEIFKDTQKRPSVASGDPEMRTLGFWLNNQLRLLNNDTLSIEKEALISKYMPKIYTYRNKVGNGTVWMENYNKLKNFVITYKRYPNRKNESEQTEETEENRLATWLYNQKNLYKQSKLEKDREYLLLKISPSIFEYKTFGQINNQYTLDNLYIPSNDLDYLNNQEAYVINKIFDLVNELYRNHTKHGKLEDYHFTKRKTENNIHGEFTLRGKEIIKKLSIQTYMPLAIPFKSIGLTLSLFKKLDSTADIFGLRLWLDLYYSGFVMIDELLNEPKLIENNSYEGLIVRLKALVLQLSPKEQWVLIGRYKHEIALRTLGDKSGVSRTTILDLRNIALQKLSHPLYIKYLLGDIVHSDLVYQISGFTKLGTNELEYIDNKLNSVYNNGPYRDFKRKTVEELKQEQERGDRE